MFTIEKPRTLGAARIISTGSYLPPAVVTNADLKQFPANVLPLIEEKTGVCRRHRAAPGQCTSDLAVEAAQACLHRAGVDADAVDAIVLATSMPDRIQPASATRVQHLLGAKHAFAFDINAVCSGFVYGLTIASSLIDGGVCRRVLLVCSEICSRFMNPSDFATYPYFGDGAGAVLLEGATPDAQPRGPVSGRVVRSILHSDGAGDHVIQIPAGGTMLPFASMKNPLEAFFKMNGSRVYKFAITRGQEVLRELCDATAIGIDNLKLIIPHQANVNIVRMLASGLGVSQETFFVNLDRVGNTASASIPIALDEAWSAGRISPGDKVATVAFGGGLAWGANLLQF